jgi:L-aminopeptidase/D-esterase-like protein
MGANSWFMAGDVNIVHVEEDAAVGALDDFGEELPLGHLGAGEGGVTADVLNGDGDLEKSCTMRTRSTVRSMASHVYGREAGRGCRFRRRFPSRDDR